MNNRRITVTLEGDPGALFDALVDIPPEISVRIVPNEPEPEAPEPEPAPSEVSPDYFTINGLRPCKANGTGDWRIGGPSEYFFTDWPGGYRRPAPGAFWAPARWDDQDRERGSESARALALLAIVEAHDASAAEVIGPIDAARKYLEEVGCRVSPPAK